MCKMKIVEYKLLTKDWENVHAGALQKGVLMFVGVQGPNILI